MVPIRIVLADPQPLFREGLKSLCAADRGLELVAEVSDASAAIASTAELLPDVVLLDVVMPGCCSFETARQLRRMHPSTRVAFLTSYPDEDYLAAYLRCGASGYILKDSTFAQFAAALRDIHSGRQYLSPRMLTLLVDDFRQRSGSIGSRPRFDTLTGREKEVLKLIAEGLAVKEIAWKLALSVKTIEAHKFNLMRKLDLHNRAQLIHYAFHKKIVRLPASA